MLVRILKSAHTLTRCQSYLSGRIIFIPKASMDDIKDMRKPYRRPDEVFLEEHLVSTEPFKQFESWFTEAKETKAIEEPNAMCIATATKDGIPSCRMVLLKGFSKDGFVFFTNYNSRKGKELEENPKASLCFYWEPLKRSVRVDGCVEKVSDEESLAYFHSRPKSSQIGACLHPQSEVIANRKVLTDAQAKLEELYKDPSAVVKKVDSWGGYRVIPHKIEFWQGQSNRVHDRISFRKELPNEKIDPTLTRPGTEGWLIERIAP